MKIADSALDLIGNTPLVRLGRIAQRHGIEPVLAKLEKCNPAGSAKDRVALSMVLDAEEKGLPRSWSPRAATRAWAWPWSRPCAAILSC